MKTTKGYLARRPNGLYVITYNYPVVTTVGWNRANDIYMPIGDQLGTIDINPELVKEVFGEQLDKFDIVKIILRGTAKLENKPNLLLSRQANQLYMISQIEPRVYQDDIYIRYGDKVSLNNICRWFVDEIFNITLLELQTIGIYLKGKILMKLR